MKKFFLISVLVFSLFVFVSCASDEDTMEDLVGDTGSSSDTGSTPADTGSSDTGSADTGSADTGSADTGSADTGSADTGSADTGSADTGSADTGDTGDTGSAPAGCTGISIVPDTFRYESYDYYADIKETIGGASKDELFIHFEGFDPEVKSYTLSNPAGIESDYQGCIACVSVLQDITDGTPAAELFQKSGTLEIEKVDEVHGIKGSIKEAKFVQISVKRDGNEEVTEVSEVPNGTCVELETAFDIICEPSCKTDDGKNKICGSDGCGGTCGTCTGENEGCSADQTQCIAYECAQVTVGDELFVNVNNLKKNLFFYQASYTDGSETKHEFWLKINGLSMNKETDLSGMDFKENCNAEGAGGDITPGWPAENSVCMYIEEDSGERKFYFAKKGTINVSTLESDGKFEAALSGDVRLVRIDTTTGNETGDAKDCIEIKNTELKYPKEN